MAVSQDIKNRTTIWSSNPALGYITARIDENCTSVFTVALIRVAKTEK